MTIQELFDTYKIVKVSEPEIEIALAHNRNAFISDVKKVYREMFMLLNSFCGVRYNFIMPSCNQCETTFILKRLQELKKLTLFI